MPHFGMRICLPCYMYLIHKRVDKYYIRKFFFEKHSNIYGRWRIKSGWMRIVDYVLHLTGRFNIRWYLRYGKDRVRYKTEREK